MACGVLAGALSSIASQPGDTILTRINTAAKQQIAAAAHAPTAAGAAAPAAAPDAVTLRSVVRELGWKGLWLGTGTRIVLTSLLSAGMFLVLDATKLAVGLSASH